MGGTYQMFRTLFSSSKVRLTLLILLELAHSVELTFGAGKK